MGLPLWLWVVCAVALIVAAAYFIREKVRQVRARRAIDNVISSVAFDELRNVLLPTGTGEQIHVNSLLLTQRGLLVIDLFDVPGMIFAGQKMEQWSVFGPKRHFTFTNPLPMLYDRMAAVRHYAGEVPVERLWHAVPAFPTISEVWLRLLETYRGRQQEPAATSSPAPTADFDTGPSSALS